MTTGAELECEECGTAFVPKTKRQRFCSATCRVSANRRPSKRGRHAEQAAAAEQPTEYVHTLGALVAATAAELQDLDQLNTVNGRAALALAYRIESPMETGSAAASMTKQLTELMDRVARAAAPKHRDGVTGLEEAARAKLRLVN